MRKQDGWAWAWRFGRVGPELELDAVAHRGYRCREILVPTAGPGEYVRGGFVLSGQGSLAVLCQCPHASEIV